MVLAPATAAVGDINVLDRVDRSSLSISAALSEYTEGDEVPFSGTLQNLDDSGVDVSGQTIKIGIFDQADTLFISPNTQIEVTTDANGDYVTPGITLGSSGLFRARAVFGRVLTGL